MSRLIFLISLQKDIKKDYHDENFCRRLNMPIKTIIINLALALLLTSCASYDFSRRTVQQGNLLPQKKISRLKIGMSKEDTAILMGSSLLSPTFDNNRWDYAYTLRQGNHPLKVHNLRLYFSHNRLSRVEHQP
jgi:outer membrane protein assembly factor BamE